MKTKIIILLLVAATLVNCSKDEEVKIIYAEENPLMGYLANTGFNQYTSNYINGLYSFEFGYRFKPITKGTINGVTFKIPDDANNIKVTIWDVSTKLPLKVFTIPTAQADVELTHRIAPLAIDPTKEYIVSFYGNDYYSRKKINSENANYPIRAGNIDITGFAIISYNDANNEPYSSEINYNIYEGDLSIIFQRTE